MKKEQKKKGNVFCEGCEYFYSYGSQEFGFGYDCEHPRFGTKTLKNFDKSETVRMVSSARKENENNDCKYFTKKLSPYDRIMKWVGRLI